MKHQMAGRRTYIPHTLHGYDWSDQPDWMRHFFTHGLDDVITRLLSSLTSEELVSAFQFGVRFQAEDQLFWIFKEQVLRSPLNDTAIQTALSLHPPLVFALIKAYPPSEDGKLPDEMSPHLLFVLQTLLKTANRLGMAVLVALEKLAGDISQLRLQDYLNLLELASLCIRPATVVQEVFMVLHDIRSALASDTPLVSYPHKHALAVAFDRAEEAADECPCDENGKPKTRHRGKAAPRVRLHHLENDDKHVRVDIRIDLPSSTRLHSNVRLQSASNPEKGWRESWMMDAVVVEAQKGQVKLELFHPPPPEMEEMDWLLYDAGSIGG
jgi:hypothetical protein